MTTSRRQHVIGSAYVIAAITAWGAYFPFAKIILLKLSPVVFLVFRLGIGAAVLLAMNARFGKSFATKRSDLVVVVLAGLIGVVAHQLLQVTGLKFTTATNVGWTLTIIPPVTGLLGWIFLKERIALAQVAGLIVAMIGVVFFISRGRPTQLSMSGNAGDLLALASVFSWSIYTVVTKSRLSSYDPLPVSTIHMGLGFFAFLLIGAWDIPAQIPALTMSDWFVIIVIGIVPSGLAYYWWNAGLQRLSAVNTSTFLFVEAIVASVAGFILLGERFTATMIFAAAIIILGVSVTQLRRGR